MPERVIEMLRLTAGQSVADIGAGKGYFSMRIARSPVQITAELTKARLRLMEQYEFLPRQIFLQRENIALYDELPRAALPADVRQVFTNDRSASAVNHLPAFEGCA